MSPGTRGGNMAVLCRRLSCWTIFTPLLGHAQHASGSGFVRDASGAILIWVVAFSLLACLLVCFLACLLACTARESCGLCFALAWGGVGLHAVS